MNVRPETRMSVLKTTNGRLCLEDGEGKEDGNIIYHAPCRTG